MKSKKVLIVVLSIISLIFLGLFWNERKRNIKLAKINEDLFFRNTNLKFRYLELLSIYINSKCPPNSNIIQDLKILKANFPLVEEKTHEELDKIIRRANSGEDVEAARDLAKIVEVKLKERASLDSNLKKTWQLHFLIEHAYKSGWIDTRAYENGLLLKEIRNFTSHELGYKTEGTRIAAAIFGGIEILYSICSRNS